jgi:hypothetical protein
MLPVLTEPTDDLKHFRSHPWAFQATFKTPLKDLKRFVSTALSPYSLDTGALTTDEVVFEPKSVIRLLVDSTIRLDSLYRFTIEAEGDAQIAQLLETVLSDWIDFLFVPSPRVLAIYADHDEYTTFYMPDKMRLSSLVKRMEVADFERVEDYYREPSGSKWR